MGRPEVSPIGVFLMWVGNKLYKGDTVDKCGGQFCFLVFREVGTKMVLKQEKQELSNLLVRECEYREYSMKPPFSRKPH